MEAGRKAQVTVFIIIGLVLVLGVGIIIFTQKQSAPSPRAVPSNVQPVNDFVIGCIDQVGKDALTILGAQGGYIKLPSVIERNPNAHVRQDPQGLVKTPFWYYEGEDRTPSLEFMEREVASYIKENLPACIDNFQAFEKQASVREKGALVPVVTIAEKQVIMTLRWPIEVNKGGQVVPFVEFTQAFPVRLKEMWELASLTIKKENELGWFENLTVDLMSANTNIPLSGMEFSCGAKKWRINDIKESLKETLQYNLPAVRIHNTRFPSPIASQRAYDSLKSDAQDIRAALEQGKEPDWPSDVPEDVFEVNRMTFDVGAQRSDLKAAFVYQNHWPLLVNAQPSVGGTLSTSQVKGSQKHLRFFCINQWHFAYDIIYPVEMLIRDDNAWNGEGYIFQFAFPVIIEDNAESRLFFGVRRFVAPETGEEFCSMFSDLQTDIKVLGFPQGSALAEELEGANITYRCLNQECRLGQTSSDGSGAIHLSTYLPEGCGNPTIIAEKEGYLTAQAPAQEKTEVFMPRVKSFPYNLIIHPYYEEVSKDNPLVAKNKQWLENQVYTTLPKTMRATVSLTARNESFEQNLLYGWDLLSAENTIGIIAQDTAYDIDIMLFKGDSPVGGYHAENITLTYEKIAANNHLAFHVIEYRPLPVQGYEQAGLFSFLYDRGTYGEISYAQALKPTFTNSQETTP